MHRLSRTDSTPSSPLNLDQTYTYDGLHRLQSLNQSVNSKDRYWKLDQLGNWDELREGTSSGGTLLENRGHNEANELTSFPSVTPAHDDAGNMTTIPKKSSGSLTGTYDAWNRLVEVVDGGTTHTNAFDGLNRRILRINSTETRHFYYNQEWQVVEDRVGTSTAADKQYVYHPNYLDAVAYRYDSTGDEHYYLHDANFNVTAVVDDAGDVEERYAYTPYGEVTIMDSSWSTITSSTIGNEYLYTGRKLDPETGLQLNRNRFYASHLGRWVNRDPIGYQGGTYNL